MKCQICPKIATYHITEVIGEDRWEEFHLCEECAKKHLTSAPLASMKAAAKAAAGDEDDVTDLASKQCEACGIKFVEFRNSGRLGCPHDYDSFQEELHPLLENIHGDAKHVGKQPRRLPKAKAAQHELASLRRQLQTAITKEQYEEAAKLRDKLKKIEEV
jgi:protein arginine kinase activator